MKANVIFPRYRRFFACVFPVLLTACATWYSESEDSARIGILSWHSESQQLSVGTLEASGQNVWLNDKPASTGMEVYNGDEVSTGPASEAYIRFTTGGFIHLDENTDPLFNWLQAGTCLLCKILFGQAFISADKVCVQTRHLRAVMGSQINIKVTHDTTTLTVVEGEVSLEGPEPLVVRSNEEVTAASQSDIKFRRLSKEELLATTKWHDPEAMVAPAPLATEPAESVARLLPPPADEKVVEKELSEPVLQTQPAGSVAKVKPPPEPIEMVRLDDVFFSFNEDTIRSDQESQLEKIADALRTHPAMRILVEGHSDPRGPVDYNRELGLRRAKAVQDFLVERGIAAGRIETTSRGGEVPLTGCPDETCWVQNRRAHLTIISK
ncbi:MAG: OmpA family protein [Acidiferrobacterales bacterium]